MRDFRGGKDLAIKVGQNAEQLEGFIVKPKLDTPSVAYKLHIKADALRLANYYQEAIGKYLNSIMLDRTNAEAYYGLGICYKNSNKTQKAIEAFEKAKKLQDFNSNIYYELGICYLITGEICAAMANLVKSIKLNPKNINAQLQLGIAHEIVEEPDMALLIYHKIIEANPKFIKAYDHQSSLLMTLDKYYEASVTLSKVLKINPDYYRANLGIAICFDKMNRLNDATRYYKKFLEQKPHSHHSERIKTRLSEIQKVKSTKQSSNFLKIVE